MTDEQVDVDQICKRPSKKLVTMLAVFLGGCGIHDFAAGYLLRGILHLLLLFSPIIFFFVILFSNLFHLSDGTTIWQNMSWLPHYQLFSLTLNWLWSLFEAIIYREDIAIKPIEYQLDMGKKARVITIIANTANLLHLIIIASIVFISRNSALLTASNFKITMYALGIIAIYLIPTALVFSAYVFFIRRFLAKIGSLSSTLEKKFRLVNDIFYITMGLIIILLIWWSLLKVF